MTDKQEKVGAVMVAGGGIAGMQAALDMADSGFRVYIVEKSPALGGVMSQLDKTFPTNDCAMCTMAPRLVGTGSHLNIDIITQAEIEKISGSAGNFTVSVRKKNRYILEDKCTGCGACTEVCPVEIPSNFDLGLSKRKAIYRNYPQAVPRTFSIDKKGISNCKSSCLIGKSVQGYVSLAAQGRFEEALKVIKRDDPFPSITSRICFHPCEEKCGRTELDEPLNIRMIERFVSDYQYENPVEIKPFEFTKKEKIAVIGAGPSGISAAYQLGIMGYRADVFDSSPKPGGMLRAAVPTYRIPVDILDREMLNIEKLGIKIHSGVTIGKDKSFSDLQKEYSAVYIAAGSQKPRTLNLPGENMNGVYQGLDFLRKVNRGEKADLGKKVAVIGGGNVAMDAARTALRLGKSEVKIYCIEPREALPAWDWEAEGAEEEDIEINGLVLPKKIIEKNGKVSGIEMVKVKLGEPDERGWRPPVPIEGTEFQVSADTVIITIGQAVDLSFLPEELKLEKHRSGTLIVDPDTQATNFPSIFAGGDVVRGPASATAAIADGKRAAAAIDRFLRGEKFVKPEEKEVVSPEIKRGMKKTKRNEPLLLPAGERKIDFREFEKPFDKDTVLAEASYHISACKCAECLLCVEKCEANAIDHNMSRESLIDLNVGAVILSPGFDLFDGAKKEEYGMGRYPNVVSSLQFERTLSASGPTFGQVLRPSDSRHPRKIAFIQCVGSREEERKYCSSVCCMYATKEAMVAKDHEPGLECNVFFIDMRAYGKGFDDYFERAKKMGIKYTRCRPSSIKEEPETRNLKFQYQNEAGELLTEEFDMVVLSSGLCAPESTKKWKEILGLKVDEYGFCRTEKLKPLDSGVEGIFVCGPYSEPKDIPDSVTQASGAASRAMSLLASRRNTLIRKKEYPPQRDVTGEEPRVGVFICHCGKNIGGVLDIKYLVGEAKKQENVAYAVDALYTCSQDNLSEIKRIIAEEKLNRVVVTSCTPRTHEPLFREALMEAGLNPYLFEMANIREHCSWVHAKDPVKATEKARKLIKMAVARSRRLAPLTTLQVDLTRVALVIGGGISGLTSALEMANQGFPVHLVEKEESLGGNARNLAYGEKGEDIQKFLSELIKKVSNHPLVVLHLNSEVTAFSGFIGNFLVNIKDKNAVEESLECGVIVAATGGMEYKGEEFYYGKDKRILTQLDLEEKISKNGGEIPRAKEIVILQCAEQRNGKRPYCSKICCTQAVKNALKIKSINPDAKIFVLYRDIRTYGFREELYREARDKGVIFIRYEENDLPEVSLDSGRLNVKVNEKVLGSTITFEPDLLVLSTGVIPHPSAESVASLLKIPLTSDKFFLEAHVKLRPVDFASEGIFLCGIAQYPKFIEESIAQASAVASRAATILSKEHLKAGGAVAVVNGEKCAACLTCVRSCPYSIPSIIKDENGKAVAAIEPVSCQGCGICAGECPAKAIKLMHYSDEQVLAMVDNLLLEKV
ncbi:MAG: FAD-dependent oxidoreductase [Firmicutes bacterium]|nr:FAD-dependent oxidoreductase [Bacillota bacterium]